MRIVCLSAEICTENGRSLTVEKIQGDLYLKAAKNALLSDSRDNGRHPYDGNKTTLNDGPVLYQLTTSILAARLVVFDTSEKSVHVTATKTPADHLTDILADRLLRLRVRILPGASLSLSCECYVLSGRGLCDEPIPLLEESYRMSVCVSECVCVCVCVFVCQVQQSI